MTRLEQLGPATGATRSRGAGAWCCSPPGAGSADDDPERDRAALRGPGAAGPPARPAVGQPTCTRTSATSPRRRAPRRARRSSSPTARDGPWTRALVSRAAGRHRRSRSATWTTRSGTPSEALPVMEALGATEDVAQLKAVLALAAMEDGRLDDAGADLRRDRAGGRRLGRLRRRDRRCSAAGRARPGRAAGSRTGCAATATPYAR